MKITLDNDDDLLATAIDLARQQDIALTRVVEAGLRMRLRAAPATPPGNTARQQPAFAGFQRPRRFGAGRESPEQ